MLYPSTQRGRSLRFGSLMIDADMAGVCSNYFRGMFNGVRERIEVAQRRAEARHLLLAMESHQRFGYRPLGARNERPDVPGQEGGSADDPWRLAHLE